MVVHVQTADGVSATARVNVTALFDGPDGQLELFPTLLWQNTDSTGTVRLRVARGARYRVVVAPQGGARQTEEWTVPATEASCERTFVLR